MNKHSFHIPVMGIGFTIDTPLKVAKYGINSVISLVDDILLEKLRKMQCLANQLPYKEISDKIEDFRAKRITSYLNLINKLTHKKFEELKNATKDKSNEVKEYFQMLPDTSTIKKEFNRLTSKYFNIEEIRDWLRQNLSMGSIDVNIMTKIDKTNFRDKEELPSEFNDAHAALRGYANSDLRSSIVLSAGLNPRLYSYIEQFEDFYPNVEGDIKKKVVIKVSDYRSALIQGKFLAKKGIWVSEYRIESGLNCGGHAFATDGFLMGPILAEFRDKRTELIHSVHEILVKALEEKNRTIPKGFVPLKITAQGGVGTAEEHQFLLEHYQLDSVGWGTPFLLVPEATTVDEPTIDKLAAAQEKDLYLSKISPFGIPFNSLKGNTKDVEKLALAIKGRPGSSCPRKYLISNKEFTDKTICTASRQYQHLKLIELDNAGLSAEEYNQEAEKVIDKSCLCVGLGTSALLKNDLDRRVEGDGVSICPGPNMAYFSRKMSLKEITDHIYGRANVISRTDRPNMFVKELNLYIKYLKSKMEETREAFDNKQQKYFKSFVENLNNGIAYYQGLFNEVKDKFEGAKSGILEELEASKQILQNLLIKIERKSQAPVLA